MHSCIELAAARPRRGNGQRFSILKGCDEGQEGWRGAEPFATQPILLELAVKRPLNIGAAFDHPEED